MLEKVTQLAEQAATNVSRRRFLRRFGRGAVAATAALAGVLASHSPARAGRKKTRVCWENSSYVPCRGMPLGSPCEFAGGGKCWSDGGPGGLVEISPGVYDCNVCKVKGNRRRR